MNPNLKIEITKMHLEPDTVNGSLKLILTDDSGDQWVLTEETGQYGYINTIKRKSDDWYFNEKNKAT